MSIDGTIETAFARLLGRQPTDAERVRLYRIKDAIGLSDNDALWSIIFALEHYQALYEDLPRRIHETAAAVERASAQRTGEIVANTQAQLIKKMTAAALQAIDATAKVHLQKEKARWLRLAAVGLAALVAISGLVGGLGGFGLREYLTRNEMQLTPAALGAAREIATNNDLAASYAACKREAAFVTQGRRGCTMALWLDTPLPR